MSHPTPRPGRRLRDRLRPRRFPTHLNTWVRGGVLAVVIPALVALLIIVDHGGDHLRTYATLVLLVVGPGIQGIAKRVEELPGLVIRAIIGVALVGGVVLGLPQDGILALAALLLGFALRPAESREDPQAAFSLLVALLITLIAVQRTGSLWAYAAIGWTALVGAITCTWIHARATRRHFLRSGEPQLGEPEQPSGLTSRAAAAAGLVGLALLAFAGGDLGLRWNEKVAAEKQARLLQLERDAIADSAESAAAAERQDQEEEERRANRSKRLRSVFPEDISWTGSLEEGVERLIVKVACSQDRGGPYYGPERPLYLRARTLDTLTETGMRLSDHAISYRLNDVADGFGDGWIEVAPNLPIAGRVFFGIEQRDLRLDDGGDPRMPTMLLRMERLARLQVSAASYRPEGSLLVADPEDGSIRFRFHALPYDQTKPILTDGGLHPRFTALPYHLGAIAAHAEAGRQLGADAVDADEVVERVLDHFSAYSYDLQPSNTDGLGALEDFFSERRGYCSFFATGALIYLRAAGIPCRVVTGFRIERYRPTGRDGRGIYLGYTSDAHAWLEVALEDGQWRTVDPTPAAARERAWALAGVDPSATAEDLPTDEAVGDVPGAGDLADAEVDQAGNRIDDPAGLVGDARLLLLPLIPMLLWLAWRYAALPFMRRHPERPRDPQARRAWNDWQLLRRALAQLGYHKRRSATGLEFARQVRSSGGPLFAGIEDQVRALYQVRFGGMPLDERQREDLDRFLELLNSAEFRQRLDENGTGRRR